MKLLVMIIICDNLLVDDIYYIYTHDIQVYPLYLSCWRHEIYCYHHVIIR